MRLDHRGDMVVAAGTTRMSPETQFAALACGTFVPTNGAVFPKTYGIAE